MERIQLHHTLIMWSMTLQELNESLEEENMLNMLIDSSLDNPTVPTVSSGQHIRQPYFGIYIRDSSRPSCGGNLHAGASSSCHVGTKKMDNTPLETSKIVVIAPMSLGAPLKDKNKQKIVVEN